MSTLAFDGALRNTGWCFSRETAEAVGLIRTTPKLTEAQSLYYIYCTALDLIKRYDPDEVAIEDQFSGKNQKTFKELCAVRGAILAACGATDVPFRIFTPGAIKKSVAGHGHADKEAVRESVQDRVSPEIKEIIATHPKQDDMWDAIAIAITAQGEQNHE